jgi:peptide deformylase
MSKMKIVTAPARALRITAQRVTLFDDSLRELVRDMHVAMVSANGVGLAAPQVGVSSRVIVTPAGVLVNPIILEKSLETKRAKEGCLSIPGKQVIVERPSSIRLQWQDIEGEFHEDTLVGHGARVICHEIDHLDGILITDKV